MLLNDEYYVHTRKIMIKTPLIRLQSHKRHSRENSSRKMIEINLGFFIQRVVVEYTKMQFLINYHAFLDWNRSVKDCV